MKIISDVTRNRILEAAWQLIATETRADAGLAEIAQRAGVSRQTVFYAFGNRSALLTAMVRHQDALTDHVQRIRAEMTRTTPDREAIIRAAEAWLDYLPLIYPVAILLDASALTDPDAASAWDDRMITALRNGFRHMCVRTPELSATPAQREQLADEIWSLLHPSQRRRLVMECGWPDADFRENRIQRIRGLLDQR